MSGNDILEKQLEAVKENSKNVRNIYLSYLVFATYIWLTAESVTHLQLLIPKEGLSLPIIGVKLGVVGFFWVAPILLFLFHIYFAIHVMKLAELLDRIRTDMQGEPDGWQDQFPGSMFVWVFLEPADKGGFISKILNVFVFFSFWCVVPIVLLRCQWQFLPYHHATINYLLQGLVILSLVFSIIFYCKVDRIKPRKTFYYIELNFWIPDWRKLRYRLYQVTTFVVSFLFVILMPLFSTTVLIIPKDKEENEACFATHQKPFEWIAWALKMGKDKEDNDEVNEKEKCLPINAVVQRNINLKKKDLALKPGETLIAEYKEDQKSLLKHYRSLDLKERNLEFADFSKADLRKADLRSAHLQGANLENARLQSANLADAQLLDVSLYGAQLQGADLRDAELQGANLFNVHLQDADLRNAKLTRVDLRNAKLQNADLRSADLRSADLRSADLQNSDLSYAYLQDADLSYAHLQDADLHSADLRGADLFSAQLQGANLGEAELHGVDLRSAELQGADLRYAKLQGADLRSAELQGANLKSTYLHGANLRYANFQGAVLRSVNLQGTNLGDTDLQGADLSSAQVQGADLRYAKLQGADLSSAQLQGADLQYAKLQGANFNKADLGVLKFLEEELTTLVKKIPQDREAKKNFENRLRSRLGKRATIIVSEDIKIRYSIEKPPKQIQFKGVTSQTKEENLAMRKDIYRDLLCKHPVLIKRNLDNIGKIFFGKFSSPLSPKEAVDYASKNCSQHLPEEYRKSKNLPQ